MMAEGTEVKDCGGCCDNVAAFVSAALTMPAMLVTEGVVAGEMLPWLLLGLMPALEAADEVTVWSLLLVGDRDCGCWPFWLLRSCSTRRPRTPGFRLPGGGAKTQVRLRCEHCEQGWLPLQRTLRTRQPSQARVTRPVMAMEVGEAAR